MSSAMKKNVLVELPQDENTMPLPAQQRRYRQQHKAHQSSRRHQPTELTIWIKQQKYSDAIRRLYLHPKEASVWACGRRKVDDSSGRQQQASPTGSRTVQKKSTTSSPSRLSRRQADGSFLPCYAVCQLPIHIACENLKKHETGSTPRAHLETLIAHLAALYPKGCQKREHNGVLPLHVALKHRASPRTVTALLCAAPSTIRELDPSGLTPLELHQLHHLRGGSDGEAIHQLLTRGPAFWNAARREAVLRLKRRCIPSEDATIGSLTVLAASEATIDDSSASANDNTEDADRSLPSESASTRADAESSAGHDAGAIDGGGPTRGVLPPTAGSTSTNVAPTASGCGLSWCATKLGHALADSYSKIHELGISVSALKATLHDIETQYQSVAPAGADSVVDLRLQDLEVERHRLQRHIARLTRELESSRTVQEAEKRPFTSFDRYEDLARLSKERDELRMQVEALQAENGQYQELLSYYKAQQTCPQEGLEPSSNPGNTDELLPRAVDSKAKDLDSVMRYASQFCGDQLRQELVEAWRGASLVGMGGTFASDYDISDLGSSEPTTVARGESFTVGGSFTSQSRSIQDSNATSYSYI